MSNMNWPSCKHGFTGWGCTKCCRETLESMQIGPGIAPAKVEPERAEPWANMDEEARFIAAQALAAEACARNQRMSAHTPREKLREHYEAGAKLWARAAELTRAG